MNIVILLPYKENFTKKNAGAVSIFVNSTNVIGQINENIWNNKKKLQLTIRDLIL